MNWVIVPIALICVFGHHLRRWGVTNRVAFWNIFRLNFKWVSVKFWIAKIKQKKKHCKRNVRTWYGFQVEREYTTTSHIVWRSSIMSPNEQYIVTEWRNKPSHDSLEKLSSIIALYLIYSLTRRYDIPPLPRSNYRLEGRQSCRTCKIDTIHSGNTYNYYDKFELFGFTQRTCFKYWSRCDVSYYKQLPKY